MTRTRLHRIRVNAISSKNPGHEPDRNRAVHRQDPHHRRPRRASRSSDSRLDVKLSPPGGTGDGTNPEQLFAAGWSACFIGAMGHAARRMQIALPSDLAVDAEVDLGTTDGAYFLQARLNVSLPGLERDVARALAEAAHQTCPYSKATRGNIGVEINLI
jgi:Ohr subfamily peroxiredoxin